MRVYVDSSALMKRAVSENHSQALAARLLDFASAGDQVLCSELAVVEVGRSIRGRLPDVDPAAWDPLVQQAMGGIDLIDLSPEIVDVAIRIGVPTLRTLDAIHVASAFAASCDVFVTYDVAQGRLCRELGMAVVSPE